MWQNLMFLILCWFMEFQWSGEWLNWEVIHIRRSPMNQNELKREATG